MEFIHRKLNLKYATNDLDSPSVEAKKKKEAFADEVFYIVSYSCFHQKVSIDFCCVLKK